MVIFHDRIYLASGYIKNGLDYINKSHSMTSYVKEQRKPRMTLSWMNHTQEWNFNSLNGQICQNLLMHTLFMSEQTWINDLEYKKLLKCKSRVRLEKREKNSNMWKRVKTSLKIFSTSLKWLKEHKKQSKIEILCKTQNLTT